MGNPMVVFFNLVPWQQFVDEAVVVVVVPDAVEALDVDLDGPAEESGVHAGVGPDGAVGQVVDGGELGVEHRGHVAVAAKLLQGGIRVLLPIVFLRGSPSYIL